MKKNHYKEKIKCVCYVCGNKTQRVFNFTLKKWARAFKCKCGSKSFQWFNW